MASSAAQDEYNELFRDKTRRNYHPSDAPAHDNSDAASFLNDDSSDDNRTQRQKAIRNNSGGRRGSEGVAASFTTAATSSNGQRQRQGSYTVPTQRHQNNTGPKGVITDAQAYRDAARTHARASESTSQLGYQREQRERHIASTQPYIPSGLNGGTTQAHDLDDGEEQGEDVGNFMDQWRQNRLRELQGQGGKRVGLSGREKEARRLHFGGLVPVDGQGYLEVVDGSGSVTVVVVLIYDDQSEVSDLIEECVVILAKKYVNTRFIKLHYLDAEMEPAGVPAVLAYRGGEKFAGLVPVFNELPDDADLNAVTLEKLFQRHQIL